ncbi:chimeric ERCC6-PGBD3 protein [Nephila pilipes]|uniref:Chimeric ERCC6-PGBD3 protein n=1 Tax=Nephila pilipes TaxID=299642 RepID=A0A8X6QYE4_NEPPI|nr:chimeric ERCC6-PGBD3 protein [Nephila pilipes]
MEGVDLMISFTGRYSIRIKSRKWTMRLFCYFPDMTVINAWVLPKKVSAMKGKSQKDIMTLVDFRTELADTLCQYQSRSENKRGRRSTNSRQEKTPEPSERPRSVVQALSSTGEHYDRVGHEKSFIDSRDNCKYKKCRKHTSWICKNVSLCDSKKKPMFRIISRLSTLPISATYVWPQCLKY